MRVPAFFSRHKRTLLIISGLCFYSFAIAYATPPGSPYTAGQTLDPACAPGDTNCSVTITTAPAGSNTELQFNNSGAFGSSSGLTFDGHILTAPNLNITGEGITVPAPTNLHAIQTCADGCGYTANNDPHNYRVYSYKIVGSDRIYSSSYATLSSNFVDDGSADNYDITVSWTAASGANGYRILKYDPDYRGYNYDAGYDTTSTSFIDDACGDVCFTSVDDDQTAVIVTPTISYTSTATIGGTLALSGPITMAGNTIYADDLFNITIGNNNAVGSGGNNFFAGNEAGKDASTADNSNFIGVSAGSGATNANSVNFFGSNAGNGATDVSFSNFIGVNAGNAASHAFDSNFFGDTAGVSAALASNSNFIGYFSGAAATNAHDSNFFGSSAGYQATNADNSNFIGSVAGSGATNAASSNFIGLGAGNAATNASNSNFIGRSAGATQVNASYSNLIGFHAGYDNSGSLTLGSNNIIIGTNISLPNATANSINIGGVLFGTGIYNDTNAATPSITPVSGGKIGIGIVSPSVTLDVGGAVGFNPLVNVANTSATGYSQIRYTGTGRSYFTGVGNASESNFGVANSWYVYDNNASAMRLVIDSTGNVGIGGTATPQNLLDIYTTSGANKGIDVQNIGTGATDTVSLKLLSAGGTYGQLFLTNSNHSTLPSVTALYTQSTNGFVVLGSTSNQLLNILQNGKVGIANSSPSYTLHVGTSAISGIVARFQNSTGTCDINPTSTSLACSSDQTLKKNIVAVTDGVLEKITALRPVTYNWNTESDTDPTHIGFIAQEVESIFPDLVVTDATTGLKSLLYTNLIPYTIKALDELNVQLTGINTLETPNTFRDTLIAWFANAENHIARIFTGELCLTDPDGTSECINKTELHQLKALLAQPPATGGESTTDTGTTTDTNTTDSTGATDTSTADTSQTDSAETDSATTTSDQTDTDETSASSSTTSETPTQ